MTRPTPTLIAITTCLVLDLGVAGQTSDPSIPQDTAMALGLERLDSGEWRPADLDPAWVALRRELNGELTRRPAGPLAALARRAAAHVDLEITNVIVRDNDQLSIRIDAQPRFLLDVPIPYLVDLYVSLDGGEWVRLGVVRDGSGCGTRLVTTSSWPLRLEGGFHHVDAFADISFLRTPVPDASTPICEFLKRDQVKELPEASADNVIQRERQIIAAMSFAISANLLGVPLVHAGTLEAGLPAVSIDRWARRMVPAARPMTQVADDPWLVEFCHPEESLAFIGMSSSFIWRNAWDTARRRSRAICMTFLTALPDDRLISLRLRVGGVNEDSGSWSIESPVFHDLSIGGGKGVLDLPFLSMLSSAIAAPSEGLPQMDVAIEPWDIQYVPWNAKPGDSITITAVVRNLGDRDAPLAHGMLALRSCCDDSNIAVRAFVGNIPAGGNLVVSLSAKMPTSGWAALNINTVPADTEYRQGPYGYLRDSNTENNDAFIAIDASR